MMLRKRVLIAHMLVALTTMAQSARAQEPVDDDDETRLGAITVTAQSRTQEVQNVPIALQIVTEESIARVQATDLSRMAAFIPGLVVDGSQPTQPRYQLRGIATDDFGVGTEPSVGVYVDGVYAARSGGALLAFNDVERIEVLKGPQGTLFGRNAAAGAISIVTHAPANDHFESRVRLRAGQYGRRYGDALLNAPLGETWALRVSAVDIRSDGWLRDAETGRRYNEDDQWGTRLALGGFLDGGTGLRLTWDHERLDQAPRPAISLIDPDLASVPFPPDPATFVDPEFTPLLNDALGQREARDFDGVTLVADHGFDWGTLTSTTAWRGFDTINRQDNDGTNRIETYLDTANVEDNESIYQELRFSATTDRTDIVAGASYYREEADQQSRVTTTTDSLDTLFRNLGLLPTPDGTLFGFVSDVAAANGIPVSLRGEPWLEAIVNEGTFRAAAVYGDVIWHATDRLNVTTGLRYTHDDKEFSWFNTPRVAESLDANVDALAALGVFDAIGLPADLLRGNVIFADPGTVGQTVRLDDSWDDLSPRLVLDWRFTPDVMGYVSATKGYKAGGFNSVQVGSRFDPERVKSFEAGLKTVFPDYGLLLNASAYYYRYENRQALRLDPDATSSGIPQYLVDTSDQDAHGLDVELEWRPTEALTLGLVGAYIDARFRAKATPQGVDLSDQPTGEPRWSAALAADYRWRGVIAGELALSLAHAYRGRTRCNAESPLQGNCLATAVLDVGEAQHRTDVRLAWTSAEGRYGAAVFVNNVFDEQYLRDVDNITATTFGTPFTQLSPPRMAGVEVSVRWD